MLDKKSVLFQKFSRHQVQKLAEFKLFLIISIIDNIWMVIETIQCSILEENKAFEMQLTAHFGL